MSASITGGVAASEPAIVATATKAANVFFILGPSCRMTTSVSDETEHAKLDEEARPAAHVVGPMSSLTGRSGLYSCPEAVATKRCHLPDVVMNEIAPGGGRFARKDIELQFYVHGLLP